MKDADFDFNSGNDADFAIPQISDYNSNNSFSSEIDDSIIVDNTYHKNVGNNQAKEENARACTKQAS